MNTEIIKSKITEKRKWLRLSQASVAKHLGISKSAMSALESATSNRGIEINELMQICKLFFCGPDELLNTTPLSQELNPSINTRITNASKTLDINDKVELNFFSNELKELKSSQSSYTSNKQIKTKTDIISIAAKNLLEEMNIKECPVDVFAIAKKMNIFVKFSVLNNLSGAFVHPTNENGAGILLNSNQPESRIRFSLAHEIAHFYLDHYPNDKSAVSMLGRQTSPIEKDADNFASELLMPSELLAQQVKKYAQTGITEIETYKLSDKFAVSYSAMLYKLKNRNYISNEQYKSYSKLKVKDLKEKIEIDNTSQIEFNSEFLWNIIEDYHFNIQKLNADSIRLIQEIAYQDYIKNTPIENRATEVKTVYENVVFWLVEERERQSKKPIIEIAKQTLSNFEVPFVDKTDKEGGCLWVTQTDENDKVIELLKKKNIFFKYTYEGGRATKKQPGWYLKKD